MKIGNEALVIARHISDFLNTYAPSQKTASVHTLKSYRTSLALYISFLESIKGITQRSLNRECFERSFIEEWLGWLATIRGCSPETCNNRLASLRVFLKYLGSRDIQFMYLFNDACALNRRKCQKKKVEGLSRDAVKALMDCPNTKTASGRRDLTFMVLVYSTAARLDEMLSLKARQLHLDQAKPNATITGKGNKVRTLYLLPKAVAHLRKYMKEFHGTDPNPESYVFYSRNTGSTGKLTQPAISKMLRKYALIAHEICSDVPLTLHAHQFRHAKASHWLEDGMNIVQISFLLGHEQLQTTMVYLDITTVLEAKALATLESENDKKIQPKWKNLTGRLTDFCSTKPIKK
ncbi:tyrosine-type recombinase/integrase [Youngiibacter multivorans]|uniref:Site-specific recombinase XerD n=1 Tax=Youngiibacter multivorans TaxID=937251 RepID=A0ABS4G8Q7_9CLOT|nr:tyrosine-type recombinase/integrase [Youngiibacter multivorans]MBP1920807.1 site-specific recombinase XerD [Youngiibacter multivorans]